ncbi:MAG: TolC family protein [Deltaproteobacteria bacterium]|nr:TolC family protein [Deltaproteobacteria bacterium]
MQKQESRVKAQRIISIFGFRFQNLKSQIVNRKSQLVLLLTACCLMVGIAHPTFAADTVSLSSLIDEAKKNNPEIQAYQKRIKAKEHRAKVEGVLDDPQFKVEVMDIPGDKPFNLGDSMQTRYTLSQMFPFPGKLSLKQKAAMKEVLMAASEAANKELEVVSMLKQAYFDYAYILESIKITKEVKEILSKMADIAQIRYSTNQASQQDVIKAHVEVTMLQNELIYLEAEKNIVMAKLNSILSRDAASPIGEPEDIKTYRMTLTQGLSLELQKTAIEKSPSLRAMEYDIQARDAEIELNKKNYYPDFMVGVAPIQRNGRFDTYDLMFSVNIPVWWGKYDNQFSEARVNLDVLKSKLKAEQNIKIFEVKESFINVEAAKRVRDLYETGLLPQAEISFQSAMVNYQTSRVDFLTVLDSQRMLKKTRVEYIKSIVEYRKNIAMLEKAVGEDFENSKQ